MVWSRRSGKSRIAGRLDHPQSLTVVSLSGDGRGLAIGPQLAAFASSLGIPTRLVPTVGHDRAPTLWACATDHTAPARPNLFLGNVPDGDDRRSDDLPGRRGAQASLPGRHAGQRRHDPLRCRRLGHRTGARSRRRRGGRRRSPHRRHRGRRSRPDRPHLWAAHHRGEIPLARRCRPASPASHPQPAPSATRSGAVHESPTLERGARRRRRPGVARTAEAHSWSACISSAQRCGGVCWVCVLCAVLGLLAAGAFMLAFPPATRGQGVAGPDLRPAGRADAGHGHQRQPASRLGPWRPGRPTRLGLTMTPDDFLNSLTMEPAGCGAADR